MKKYIVNEPIRVVEKEENVFEVLITREFTKIEVNSEVLDVIKYLKSEKKFNLDTINEYLTKKGITNKEEYHSLFDFLIEYNLVVENIA